MSNDSWYDGDPHDDDDREASSDDSEESDRPEIERPAEPLFIVERGQPVIITVVFGDGNPDGVYFACTRPGSGFPHVDDGFGQKRSRIEHLGNGIYRYTIDTESFNAGEGKWHLWGEWARQTRDRPYVRAHVRGRYRILPFEPQLL